MHGFGGLTLNPKPQALNPKKNHCMGLGVLGLGFILRVQDGLGLGFRAEARGSLLHEVSKESLVGKVAYDLCRVVMKSLGATIISLCK